MSSIINTDLTEIQKKALQDWFDTKNTDLALMLNGFFECVKTHQIEFGDSGDNQHLEQEIRESIQKIKEEIKTFLRIEEGSIVVKSSVIQIFDAKLCFDYRKIYPLIAKAEIQFIHCQFLTTKEDLPIGWEGSGRVFEKKLFFHDCVFEEFVSFSSSVFKEAVEFNNSAFVSSVDFHECIFEKNACFYGVDFKGVPNFSQAKFLQKINLVNTNLNFSFEECRKFVENEKKRRIERRGETLKMGKPITGAQIANDFRDSFRLFKGNLIDGHNQLDATNYRKIELYFKEIEMEEGLENPKKQFDWGILVEKIQKFYIRVSESIFPREMPMYVEYNLVKFYRKISDHHFGLFDIANIFVFFVAFHSIFVFGTMWGAKNFLLYGTDTEIRWIAIMLFCSIVGIIVFCIFYVFHRKKIGLDIFIRLAFLLLFSIFVYRFFQPLISRPEYVDLKNQLMLFTLSFGLVASYCLFFLFFYFMFKCRFLKNLFYFLSYPCFLFFFVTEPYIVAPVLGVFQGQKTDNVILEKYIQTTNFSEVKDLVQSCKILNQQIDWTHDQFQQVRQVLLKHSDEFLLNGECFKKKDGEDQKTYEIEVRKVSIMVLKNIVLNNALKTINMIYFIVVVLLLFSLVKTARKNSIVPS